MDRLDALDPRTRTMVEEEYGRYKAARRRGKEVVPTPQRSDKTRAKEVRTAAGQKKDAWQERHSFDNVLQSQELAERLQYLVGKRYIDDENGKLYEVAKVWFSRSHEAVVGTRRPLTGHSQAYDDDCFFVFGISGLLQLTELYDVGHAVGDVNWPKSGTEWIMAQGTDSDLRDIISKVDPDKEVDSGAKGVVKLITEGGDSGAKVLYRRHTVYDRVIWQRWVPERLHQK
jgi:hypothetical protein